jgi:hypothetical protein
MTSDIAAWAESEEPDFKTPENYPPPLPTPVGLNWHGSDHRVIPPENWRLRAARELADEFGDDISEWLV